MIVSKERNYGPTFNIHVPKYLLSAMRALYQDSVYILGDGDMMSEEIMATQGFKQGCPLSPLLYALFTNDLGKFLNTSHHGATTALQTAKISHCEYADEIALTTNTAHHLQLDRFKSEWNSIPTRL